MRDQGQEGRWAEAKGLQSEPKAQARGDTRGHPAGGVADWAEESTQKVSATVLPQHSHDPSDPVPWPRDTSALHSRDLHIWRAAWAQ